MITKRFIPEGWNEKTAILDKNNIEEYIKNKNTLQGIVKNCDEQYNLHIDLGNNIEGKYTIRSNGDKGEDLL